MTTATIEGFRVSARQLRLWRLSEEGAEYRVEGALLLTGDVRDEAFLQALRDLGDRHEILRTTFQALPGVEAPLQVIGEPSEPELRQVRAAEMADGISLEELVAGQLEVESRRPFDLRRGPLARYVLLDLDERRRLLLLVMSALVADPLSLDNAVDQIVRAYACRVAGAETDPAPVQYADFSEWQASLEEEETAEEGRAHWSHLAPGALADPLARYQNGDRRASRFHPGVLSRPVDPGLAAAATALTARGVPLPIVFLAAWCATLRRLGEVATVVVGALVDGRPLEPLRGAIGPFAGYVPVSCGLEEHFDFHDAVRTVAAAFHEAADHQLSFAPADHGVGFLPVLFDFREVPAAREAAGLRVSWLWQSARVDRHQARLAVVAMGGELRLELHFEPACFTPDDAGLLLDRFATLLREGSREPGRPLGDLEILGSGEREQVLVGWNRTRREVPWEGPFHRLVELQAQRAPEATALVAGGREITYRELDQRASRLARYLRRWSVGLDSRVALCLDRSPEQIVALLAVLKRGAAFVPLDPSQPAERLRFMLAEVEARAVLTQQRLLPLFLEQDCPPVPLDILEDEIAGESGEPFGIEAGPENLAYAIFTSGSSGRPKGVLIRHGALVNLLAALDQAVYAGESGPLRVSLNAPLSFDAAIKQLGQLARGHALCLMPEEIRADGEALLSFLRAQRVDVLDCTPTQLRLLLDAGLAGPGAPRRVLVGGEAIDPGLWQTLAGDPDRRFYNVYGPTECTVDTTACRILPGTPTIGRPLANVRVYVLDERLRPVPAGAAGELWIGGAGLARGYARRPELTAGRFVPDPFSAVPGMRLYRTGDRVRHLPEGALEFLGRLDHQIKLRGHRVELGEIEAVLREHPAVAAAVVDVREDQPGNRRLIAYVTPKRRQPPLPGGRQRHRLPNGMAVAGQNRNETEYLFREIFENRCYVRHGVRLPDAPVVLDVGANIGMFSLFVARHRPAARIYAFEPLEPLCQTFQANADLYAPGAHLFPFGLADQERRDEFTFYPRYTMMSGRSSSADAAGEVTVIKRFLENARGSGAADASAALLDHADELLEGRFQGELHEVLLRRLSDVLREQEIERVDLLKVDVQRAEMDVLRGIEPADWPKVLQVVMEVHDAPGAESEGRLAAITSLLESHGFLVTSEQDELLAGTDRHNLYAVRPGLEGAGIGADEAAAEPDGADLTAGGLRELAQSRLPEVMVPAAYVVLDELPLTRNGKVDRAALPAPDEEASGPDLVAAQTPFEGIMASIWAGVLGHDRVGASSNFFELGGHSLLATQLMSRVREIFQIEMPLRALFESPTVAGLARRAEEAVRAANGLQSPPVTPVPRDGELPLSFAQQRLWFIDQLEPGGTFYSSNRALWLEGPLDLAVLERTLAEVVRRHEVLRTAFPVVGGRPIQKILPAVQLTLPRVDLSGLPAAAAEEEVGRLAARDTSRAFDLAVAPLLRVTLLRQRPERHALLFGMHHIVCDAWSMGILVREVGTLYPAFLERLPSPLPELPVQYADFSRWQRDWLRGEALAAHLLYWRQRLGSPLPQMKLPFERQHAGAPTYRGRRSTFLLPEGLAEPLAALSHARGATLFITLLAGFKALLARCSGQEDLIVGTAIAGRNRIETEGLIGFFVNMLPLRTDLSGNPTFLDLLTRVREAAFGAYAHQGLPFDKLVEELQPERGSGPAPIFRVAFGFQNAPPYDLRLPGLELTTIPVEYEVARFPLTVWMWEEGGQLASNWTYSTDLFDAATIAGLHESFASLLESAVAAPQTPLKDLTVVSAAAREEEERRRRQREDANVARLKRVERRSVGGR
jgi:amino acid adenylation domain-containing protein/FkbM family methyltransferase